LRDKTRMRKLQIETPSAARRLDRLLAVLSFSG